MTHQFSVSDLGLRLIKAYEGYRPESRILISGNNVVGYGHRISDQDAIALTRAEAETLLREDIQPVEDLVNEAVFAPLTQGQFDALCSLAYNIGPDAFLKSDVVKAVNNGRPIEAANSFDIWRKGEIDGEIFVVDALVRRRTAEKALFLKPDRRTVTSPRDSLPPKPDKDAAQFEADDLPVYTRGEAEGYVDQIPYDQRPNPGRRRTDGPAGVLELSEYYEDDAGSRASDAAALAAAYLARPKEDIETITDRDEAAEITPGDDISPLRLSPIAEAAASVSERLDALIDDQAESAVDLSDMPDSLLTVEPKPPAATVLPFRSKTDAPNIEPAAEIAPQTDGKSRLPQDVDDKAGSVTDTNTAPPRRAAKGGDSASRFIQSRDYVETQPSSIWAFGVMMLSGLIMFAFSLYASIKDPVSLLGPWGPVAVMAGLMMGGMIILGSIYYILKSIFSD
jgi:GH24 family phage-related lysozyme (muramidase)